MTIYSTPGLAEKALRDQEAQATIAALRTQLTTMQSDADVGKAIRELPDNYTVTNDGLIAHQWEISEWFPKGDHRHFNAITLEDCLRVAGLLPKETAYEFDPMDDDAWEGSE